MDLEKIISMIHRLKNFIKNFGIQIMTVKKKKKNFFIILEINLFLKKYDNLFSTPEIRTILAFLKDPDQLAGTCMLYGN
jgi:hypothetical protein